MGKIRLSVIGMLLVMLVILLASCGDSTNDKEPRLLLNHSNMIMKIGDAVNLQAFYGTSQDTAKVTWNSDDISVITVTDNGKVEAIGKGNAVVTAMDGNGTQAKCDIRVKNVEAESIKLDKLKATLNIEESLQLHADVYPEEASDKDMQWISEDNNIAIVNSNGLVTGKSEGIINIICRSSNGKEASCTVIVENSHKTADSEQSDSQYNGVQDGTVIDKAYTYDRSFYGIWCGAAKEESDAEKKAEELRNKGWDARVFVTTDWSNLNQEKWYVVTAGVYGSQSEAEEYLPSIKTKYPDAYIKYSGGWQGY